MLSYGRAGKLLLGEMNLIMSEGIFSKPSKIDSICAYLMSEGFMSCEANSIISEMVPGRKDYKYIEKSHKYIFINRKLRKEIEKDSPAKYCAKILLQIMQGFNMSFSVKKLISDANQIEIPMCFGYFFARDMETIRGCPARRVGEYMFYINCCLAH